MRKKILYIIFFFSLLLYACERKQKSIISDPHTPNIAEASGNVISLDSMAPPLVVPVKGVKTVAAGKPKVVTLNANFHPVGTPSVILAGTPRLATPGRDTFRLPSIAAAIDSPFIAGLPEIVVAGDPEVTHNNPAGISSFKLLQGLKTNNIFPMMQDKAGNIWIASWEGGVSRYDGRSFTNYTSQQGLCNDQVWSMTEDSRGNLWFGSLGAGVSKYDGKSFTNYSTKHGLSENSVLSILEDDNKNLWFATINGVNKYDGKTFVHYTALHGLVNDHVRSILKDRNGNLWFGTKGGVSKFDGVSFSNYTIDEGLHSNDISGIIQDREGNLWFGAVDGGIDKFDGKSFFHYSVKQGLSSDKINEIIEDRNGNLWIATADNGVNKFDGKTFTHFGMEQGLSRNVVHSILEDRSGILWFGTDGGGVCKYDGGYFTHYNASQGLLHGNITSISKDRKNDIWISFTGGGVNKFDGNSISRYSTAQGLSSISTQSVFADSKGNIWIATWGSGVDKYDHKSFTNYSSAQGFIYDLISSITEDRNGNLWFGTYGGIFKFDGKSFTRYNAQQGLTNESVSCILADKENNIWAGTYGGGVFKFDGTSITNYSTRHGLSSNNVLSIYEDRLGRIWIGSYETGVDMFNGKTFVNYTDKDGLNNNRVGSIREDSIGNIWLLTINGLWKMRLPGNEPGLETQNINSAKPLFKKYLFSDGFLGVGSDFNTLLYDNDGIMWAGASDHLTAFHSEREIPDSIQPNIQLTGISLYNQNINWLSLQKKQDTALLLGNGVTLHGFKFNGLSKWYFIPGDLSLASDNNYLSFQFVGIATRRTQHIKYKYLLEGLDKNWSTVSGKTEAVYNNLAPGNYTFKLKAVNSEGYWSTEYSYPFIIRAPWWQTLWFRIAAFCCLITLFYGLIRWRLHEKFRFRLERSEKEKRLAELQQKTSELEMQALRAQMNPHFIFNSLNSINRFILQNNKAQASEYLTKFSRLVRLILQNSQAALITLESELESLKLYLELEAVRFDHHFEFKITVENDLDIEIIKVPPLIIQPYAENAIWHGLMHKEEKGKLEIKLYQQDDSLCCKITDDGVGRMKAAEFKSKSASATKSMGMQITASRIEMLQKKKQSDSPIKIKDLVLADGSAGGTEVIIKIPVIYA